MKPGPNRKANIWTARVIPVLLFALVIYSSWVFTHLIAIDYLLNPSLSLGIPPRTGVAIAVLVLYYVLLTTFIVFYTRLIYTIATNPGFVQRGPQWHIQKAQKSLRNGYSHRKSHRRKAMDEKTFPEAWIPHNDTIPHLREDEFWRKDIFICNYDGRPPFCSSCFNYKLDRTHHCREVNRCVRKMDHFCPWVGGIISETSFKFFIQLTFYTALYTFFTLVVVVYYFAERRRQEPGFLDVHWVLVLAFAALFFLFGAGIFSSSFQFVCINTTTIENLSNGRVHYLAAYMPRPEEIFRRLEAAGKTSDLRTITYPRPPEEQLSILQQHGANPLPPSSLPQPPAPVGGQPPSIPTGTVGAPNSRTFAILATAPGSNPWDLGSTFANICQVMGNSLIDWFLPVRYSPCTNHESQISMFLLNPKLPDWQEGGIEDEILSAANGRETGHETRKKKRRTSRSQRARPEADKSDHQRNRKSRRHSSRRREESDTTALS